MFPFSRRDLSRCQAMINEYKYNKDFEMVPQTKFDQLDVRYSKLKSDHSKLTSIEKALRLQNTELLTTVMELTQQLEMARHAEEDLKRNGIVSEEGVDVQAEVEDDDDERRREEENWETVEFAAKRRAGKTRKLRTAVEDVT